MSEKSLEKKYHDWYESKFPKKFWQNKLTTLFSSEIFEAGYNLAMEEMEKQKTTEDLERQYFKEHIKDEKEN